MASIIPGVGGTPNIGGAVSGLFSSIGDMQAANEYSTEATIEGQNATIATASGKIQGQMTQRNITLATGTEEATTAAGGFSNSGSGGDLMRASLEQGALAKSLVANQSAITVLGYQEKQAAAKAQEKAANTKAIGGIIGSVASLFGF